MLCWLKWKLFQTIAFAWSRGKGHLLCKKRINSRLTGFKNPMAYTIVWDGLENQKKNILLADTKRQQKLKHAMTMRCVGLQFVDSRACTQNDVMLGTRLHLNKWYSVQMHQRHSEAMRGMSSSPGLSCGEQHEERAWASVPASLLRSSSIF